MNAPLAYIAPPFCVAVLFINLQLSIAMPETSPFNIIAPPSFEFPFINVILFKITLFKEVMLNILDCPIPFIVKPLPLIVIGFVMVIPLFENESS